MPLVKRSIEPRHLCRGALPDGVASELECVTNSTLAAVIKQLGGLSRHAEDIFGELFTEANSFYLRMNNLQERVDLLAVKVTQLDSTVEEVSLQDINMRKAFRSSTIQDQQVVSRSSILNPVMEMYQHCDKPPPLNILTPYRDDRKDGLKFYTDPSYFFNLWKEKMLQATENKRKEKRRHKEQKHVEESSGREVKKVRKARNRRQEWNLMAYDKEFRPDARLTPSPYHGMSSDGSLSPDRSGMSDDPVSPHHDGQVHDGKDELITSPGGAGQTQSLDRTYRPPTTSSAVTAATSRQHSLGRTQPHHHPHYGAPPTGTIQTMNGTRTNTAKEASDHQIPPAPPPPPPLMPSFPNGSAHPAASATLLPATAPGNQAGSVAALSRPYSPSPPPPPPANYVPSPSRPGAGAPPPPSAAAPPLPPVTDGRKPPGGPAMPVNDARSDLLAAIRRGIQLRKVQEQREQEEAKKREPAGNDVATILSRRIAVEYSESEDESEPEDNEWSD
ncbi:actin-binding protein WASF3-like [Polymixia lowei]